MTMCTTGNGRQTSGMAKRNRDTRVRGDDGSTYKGHWKADMRHGQGKYVNADGGVYEGQWAEGVLEFGVSVLSRVFIAMFCCYMF
jgi:hypothetical protein